MPMHTELDRVRRRIRELEISIDRGGFPAQEVFDELFALRRRALELELEALRAQARRGGFLPPEVTNRIAELERRLTAAVPVPPAPPVPMSSTCPERVGPLNPRVDPTGRMVITAVALPTGQIVEMEFTRSQLVNIAGGSVSFITPAQAQRLLTLLDVAAQRALPATAPAAMPRLFPAPAPTLIVIAPDFKKFAVELDGMLKQLVGLNRERARAQARVEELEAQETRTTEEDQELERRRASVERQDEAIDTMRDRIREAIDAFYQSVLTDADTRGVSTQDKGAISDAQDRVRKAAARKGANAASAEEEAQKLKRLEIALTAATDPDERTRLQEEIADAKRERDRAEEAVKTADADVARDLLETAKLLGCVPEMPEFPVVIAPIVAIPVNLAERLTAARRMQANQKAQLVSITEQMTARIIQIDPPARDRLFADRERIAQRSEILDSELTQLELELRIPRQVTELDRRLATVENQLSLQQDRLTGLTDVVVVIPTVFVGGPSLPVPPEVPVAPAPVPPAERLRRSRVRPERVPTQLGATFVITPPEALPPSPTLPVPEIAPVVEPTMPESRPELP